MYVAWPRADRVEIHIFSSDGQTRLGCFVHVFIDLSAEMLPRIVNHEDDSSIVPGAVSQETDKGEKICNKLFYHLLGCS